MYKNKQIMKLIYYKYIEYTINNIRIYYYAYMYCSLKLVS